MNQTNTRKMAIALRQRSGDKADELLKLLKRFSWNVSVRLLKRRQKERRREKV